MLRKASWIAKATSTTFSRWTSLRRLCAVQAVIQRKYGRPRDVLTVDEAERPVPQAGQVLVEVRAASVHADVWHTTTGRPLMLRVMGNGFFRPRGKIPGTDVAGVVAEVGEGASGLEVGDRVFGETIKGHQWKNGGSFAEYVAVDAASLREIPDGVGFTAAGSVPTSGLIAHRTMTEEGKLQPGDSVLINGAGGAVGTVALQIAKARGAQVVAVDRTEKHAMLLELGADAVIDYTAEDFTQSGKLFDVLYDIPGNRSFEDLGRVLKPGGRYVLIGHDDFGKKGSRFVGSAVPNYLRLATRRPFGKSVDIEVEKSDDPLGELARLLADGKLTPPIGGVFALDAAVDAMEALAAGDVAGKIVLTP